MISFKYFIAANPKINSVLMLFIDCYKPTKPNIKTTFGFFLVRAETK